MDRGIDQRDDTLPREAVVADIGGTNARFAVADLATLELSRISQSPCAAHPTFAAALCAYLAELSAPVDHAAIARACGWHGVRVEDPNALAGALRAASNADRPTLIDVISDPAAVPPITAFDGKLPDLA